MSNPALTETSTGREAVIELVSQVLKITQSDNFDPYFDFFTDDAHWMMPSSSRDIGLAEAKSFYSFTKKFRFEQQTEINEILVSGDLAMARISLDGYLKPKQASETSALRSISRHIWILQRQASGEWKISHDIWNNPKTE